MAYTTIDDPAQYFNTVLFTGDIQDSDGTGHDQAVTGVGFQPDWIWHKCRSHANQHMIVDSVRGTGGSPTQMLFLSAQDNENEKNSNSNGAIESIDSDGFTVTAGNDSSSKSNNAGANGRTYVDWCWKAGTSFTNDASATSVGTIDSSGSANDTAGFSIVSYTGTGSAGTIKHGLSTAPNWIIFKNRETAGQNWIVYHSATSSTPADDFLKLNADSAVGSSTSYGNNTAPTTSVFSVGANDNTNKSSEGQIAYCFAEKQGYSKFGSYTGNGNADGTFVYTGFKPAWLIVKQTDTAGEGWYMWDNKRSSSGGSNENDRYLIGSVGNAEGTLGVDCDFLSNGFKHYYTGDASNGDGHSYVYMAFAESPFVNSNKVPTNAR